MPPGAPGFAEAQAREAAQLKQYGFLRVCDANLERYHIFFWPSIMVEPWLAFQPVELKRTPFAGFARLGSSAESISGTRSRLYRAFACRTGTR